MHTLATLLRLLISGGLAAVVLSHTGLCLVGLLVIAFTTTVVFSPLRDRLGVS